MPKHWRYVGVYCVWVCIVCGCVLYVGVYVGVYCVWVCIVCMHVHTFHHKLYTAKLFSKLPTLASSGVVMVVGEVRVVGEVMVVGRGDGGGGGDGSVMHACVVAPNLSNPLGG